MTIGGLTFTVNQSGAVTCTYAISPGPASFPQSGGSNSVTVTTAAGCGWTAVANAMWIHVTSGASGTGGGVVQYSVDANASTARSGSMTIAGQTFNVSQAGAATGCTYAISPSAATLPQSGGSRSVTLTTQAGCGWTAVANATWIHVTSGASGTASGIVRYSVDANASPSLRMGTLTIGGLTFTVSQSGTVACNYSISPGVGLFRTAGGNGSVAVTAPAGCSWTAVSLDAWVTITGGSSGSGNGTVTFSVAPSTGLQRRGTIAIATLTFIVGQIP